MATKPRKRTTTRPAKPSAAPEVVEYAMHPFVQATLGEYATKVSKAHPTGSQFFIGETADAEGRSGIALCEVAPDGTMVKHFGTRAQLTAILDAHA